MNIVYCFDKNYQDFTLNSITSLVDNMGVGDKKTNLLLKRSGTHHHHDDDINAKHYFYIIPNHNCIFFYIKHEFEDCIEKVSVYTTHTTIDIDTGEEDYCHHSRVIIDFDGIKNITDNTTEDYSSFENGICDLCGLKCTHDYIICNKLCLICGMEINQNTTDNTTDNTTNNTTNNNHNQLMKLKKENEYLHYLLRRLKLENEDLEWKLLNN